MFEVQKGQRQLIFGHMGEKLALQADEIDFKTKRSNSCINWAVSGGVFHQRKVNDIYFKSPKFFMLFNMFYYQKYKKSQIRLFPASAVRTNPSSLKIQLTNSKLSTPVVGLKNLLLLYDFFFFGDNVETNTI